MLYSSRHGGKAGNLNRCQRYVTAAERYGGCVMFCRFGIVSLLASLDCRCFAPCCFSVVEEASGCQEKCFLFLLWITFCQLNLYSRRMYLFCLYLCTFVVLFSIYPMSKCNSWPWTCMCVCVYSGIAYFLSVQYYFSLGIDIFSYWLII